MNRPEHSNTDFFVGEEVEHTPVHGHRTLFVVGVQDVEQIFWKIGEVDRKSKHPITHIYFGANMSFPILAADDADGWRPWESMIQASLARGYWCTLDIDISCVEGLTESGLCENSSFIPMISAKLPYIDQLGYNATLKLDDKDFKASNPGVWCHSLHDLKNRDLFTHWSKYTKDEPL